MPPTTWIRLGLCGLLAGIVWFVLNALSLSLFAPDLVAVVERGGPYARWGGLAFLLIDLGMGLWAIWLYAAIKPRFGPGARTAALAGLAWWAIKTLQSAKWVGLGFVAPGVVLVPLGTTLVAAVAATMTGAWLYDRGSAAPTSARLE